MKKQILIAITITAAVLCAQAQNVYIPDTTFKRILIENTELNTNGDEEIQISEAETYTGQIQVQRKEIADLTGIEVFINLTYLNCSGNNLAELDLHANTKLEYLNIGSNYSLESFDLGVKPMLKAFYASSNIFERLDVSGASLLESLNCSGGNIKSLDLSQNTNLDQVWAHDNKLKFLDVRNGSNANLSKFSVYDNPDLCCINVDVPEYSESNWSEVDEGVVFSTNCEPFAITFNVSDEFSNPLIGAELRILLIESETFLTNASGQIILSDIGEGTFPYQLNAAAYKGMFGEITVLDADVTVNLQMVVGETDTVFVPDATFRNHLLTDTLINCNNDDKIQYTEAFCYFGEIDVANYYSIEDMTGIEAFVNLESLKCSSNKIDSLNVSSNTKLQLLQCTYNSMDTLILGELPEFYGLSCYNNNLTGYDVSRLPSLMHVNSGHNSIQYMDFRQNRLLQKVMLNNNTGLSGIDMRNGNNEAITLLQIFDNSDLFCVSVDDVAYAYTNLSGSMDSWTNFSSDCSVSYDISFIVSDGANPVENAHVNFEGTLKNTDAEGKVYFPNVSMGEHYYSVIADGFASVSSTLSVTGEYMETVLLSAGSSDIVFIPDNNFRFALIIDEFINSNHDFDIQVTEAESYSDAINVSRREIYDLTGIEAFKNLTSLNCSGNNLTELNLHTNSVIEYLNIGGNMSLESLELGEMAYLKSFYLTNTNVQSLDLSEKLLLESLNCSYTNLTGLDLSQNTHLNQLWAIESFLEYLDVRNGNNSNMINFNVTSNSALSCITVDDPAYSYVNWTDVDEGIEFSTNCNGSNDSKLKQILIDGETLEGFVDSIFSYIVELPYGTTDAPTIEATAADSNASVEISQAATINDTSFINVVAENGHSKQSYTIDFTVLTSSIRDAQLLDFHVYPNPANDYIIIEGSQTPDKVRLFSLQGQEIKDLTTNTNSVDITALVEGVYILQIEVNKNVTFRKIIKQ